MDITGFCCSVKKDWQEDIMSDTATTTPASPRLKELSREAFVTTMQAAGIRPPDEQEDFEYLYSIWRAFKTAATKQPIPRRWKGMF